MVATTLPAGLLLVTLVAPLMDLLVVVQPGLELAGPSLAGSTLAALLLVVTWGRYPRTNWLAAAWLAAVASVALRLAGADQASLLSLLSILALGVGGAFASRVHEMDALLELQPSVARR
jgi:hypothetical protein